MSYFQGVVNCWIWTCVLQEVWASWSCVRNKSESPHEVTVSVTKISLLPLAMFSLNASKERDTVAAQDASDKTRRAWWEQSKSVCLPACPQHIDDVRWLTAQGRVWCSLLSCPRKTRCSVQGVWLWKVPCWISLLGKNQRRKNGQKERKLRKKRTKKLSWGRGVVFGDYGEGVKQGGGGRKVDNRPTSPKSTSGMHREVQRVRFSSSQQTETGTGTGTETETETVTVTEAGTGTGTETETVTEAGTGTEAETKTVISSARPYCCVRTIDSHPCRNAQNRPCQLSAHRAVQDTTPVVCCSVFLWCSDCPQIHCCGWDLFLHVIENKTRTHFWERMFVCWPEKLFLSFTV